MKLKALIAAVAAAFALEIAGAVLLLLPANTYEQDAVAVNAILKSVERDWGGLDTARLPRPLDYTVLDADGRVLYATRPGITASLADAVRHRDTLLDITADGSVAGKLIVYNDTVAHLSANRTRAAVLIGCGLGVQALLLAGYVLYLNRAVFSPFRRLKGFAARVAGGDLDVPLTMDRRNLFGPFTEAFDLMRAELKRAREAEAAANRSKKELVARLSHDIKTPVASVKAVAECGCAAAKSGRDRERFAVIERKADQIGGLVDNLFSATLQELTALPVSPRDEAGEALIEMLRRADYRNRIEVRGTPEGLLFYDPVRLQQVFDNVISNSYKYADTAIAVSFFEEDGLCCVKIEDFGGGVDEAELPFLTEQYRRGKNAAGKDGAGLGLFIARELMRGMSGQLAVSNTGRGLAVTLGIRRSGGDLRKS